MTLWAEPLAVAGRVAQCETVGKSTQLYKSTLSTFSFSDLVSE